MPQKYTLKEISSHNKEDSCWIIIKGKVYDITEYLLDHPGGSEIILSYAGKDATEFFNEIHAESILEIGEKYIIGEYDPMDQNQEIKQNLPPISQILNIYDLQDLAKQVLTKEAWNYFTSGANDEITLRENELAFQRIWLRPRCLVNVNEVSTATKIFNIESSFPCYISSTALAKLAHQDGEIAVIKAASNQKVIYMVPTLASVSIQKIYKAKSKDQDLFFQLYMNSDKQVTLNLIRQAEEAGVKAIVLTVDAPFFGKRERDMRKRATVQSNIQNKIGQDADKSQGVSQVINQFLDSSTDWETLQWLMKQTHLPFIIKGIQTYEDALLAYKYGAKAIVISNHGGRQLDFARSAIEVLQEVTTAFESAGIKGKMQIYIDGGIRRGMDIFKAIALGATAVGIGRPMLYGLGTYGQEGVEKVLQLLRSELEMCMKLVGVKTISEIKPDMCISKDLTTHTVESPRSFLTVDLYEPLKHASKL